MRFREPDAMEHKTASESEDHGGDTNGVCAEFIERSKPVAMHNTLAATNVPCILPLDCMEQELKRPDELRNETLVGDGRNDTPASFIQLGSADCLLSPPAIQPSCVSRQQDCSAECMKSISVANLAKIFRRASKIPALAHHGRALSSEHLRVYLRNQEKHAKEIFGDLYSDTEPLAALTYEWKLPFNDILGFLNTPQIRDCNACHPKGEPILEDTQKLTLWMDIFFVDQNGADVSRELVSIEDKYCKARFHLVLGTDTLSMRAWCLHEIGVRCQAGGISHLLKSVEHEDVSRYDILSFTCETKGLFFEDMQASVESDLHMIRARILETYGCPDRFNKAVFRIFRGSAW
uniref:Uncharacterized protein n=1 Tax=Cryptomonas curvata TaxID=233186 RepID=A0A7S0LZK0_9CRYP|mmetsp:Transcript_17619/g.37187  ORF Transcript_17619/g.37187 Transcript_17619/m.37187 type:complete len:348 (+) Transcript_17619:274-1317(+)